MRQSLFNQNGHVLSIRPSLHVARRGRKLSSKLVVKSFTKIVRRNGNHWGYTGYGCKDFAAGWRSLCGRWQIVQQDQGGVMLFDFNSQEGNEVWRRWFASEEEAIYHCSCPKRCI